MSDFVLPPHSLFRIRSSDNPYLRIKYSLTPGRKFLCSAISYNSSSENVRFLTATFIISRLDLNQLMLEFETRGSIYLGLTELSQSFRFPPARMSSRKMVSLSVNSDEDMDEFDSSRFRVVTNRNHELKCIFDVLELHHRQIIVLVDKSPLRDDIPLEDGSDWAFIVVKNMRKRESAGQWRAVVGARNLPDQPMSGPNTISYTAFNKLDLNQFCSRLDAHLSIANQQLETMKQCREIIGQRSPLLSPRWMPFAAGFHFAWGPPTARCIVEVAAALPEDRAKILRRHCIGSLHSGTPLCDVMPHPIHTLKLLACAYVDRTQRPRIEKRCGKWGICMDLPELLLLLGEKWKRIRQGGVPRQDIQLCKEDRTGSGPWISMVALFCTNLSCPMTENEPKELEYVGDATRTSVHAAWETHLIKIAAQLEFNLDAVPEDISARFKRMVSKRYCDIDIRTTLNGQIPSCIKNVLGKRDHKHSDRKLLSFWASNVERHVPSMTGKFRGMVTAAVAQNNARSPKTKRRRLSETSGLLASKKEYAMSKCNALCECPFQNRENPVNACRDDLGIDPTIQEDHPVQWNTTPVDLTIQALQNMELMGSLCASDED